MISKVNDNLLRKMNSVNLNLMLIFYTLYRERHLTKAAEKLCLSQPAVSHSAVSNSKCNTRFNERLMALPGYG